METIIQCVFVEQTKNCKNYKPTYYKKVGNDNAEKISHNAYMDLIDTATIVRPIYKDLK